MTKNLSINTKTSLITNKDLYHQRLEDWEKVLGKISLKDVYPEYIVKTSKNKPLNTQHKNGGGEGKPY